jgi:hypothetical protein
VRNWWRWILRGLALVALAGAGVLLALHPLPSSSTHLPGTHLTITASCLSPLDQIGGRTQSITLSPLPPINRSLWFITAAVPSDTPCRHATTGREHDAEALGIGAVILIALSFWRRRRSVVIVPVNPSVL